MIIPTDTNSIAIFAGDAPSRALLFRCHKCSAGSAIQFYEVITASLILCRKNQHSVCESHALTCRQAILELLSSFSLVQMSRRRVHRFLQLRGRPRRFPGEFTNLYVFTRRIALFVLSLDFQPKRYSFRYRRDILWIFFLWIFKKFLLDEGTCI